MSARTFAIGDIHGHPKALRSLLSLLELRPNDKVVFLGDYVDRGPDSRGVLQQVIELSDQCRTVALMGNHEELMRRALADSRALPVWLANGGDTALQSYGADGIHRIPPAHLEFLSCLPRFHETETHFFIHANYAPNWRLEQHDSTTALWLPLTDLPGPHYSRKTGVVGHTPQPDGKVLDLGHLICLDTGCGLGGWLTAMEMGNGRIWQVDEKGNGRTR